MSSLPKPALYDIATVPFGPRDVGNPLFLVAACRFLLHMSRWRASGMASAVAIVMATTIAMAVAVPMLDELGVDLVVEVGPGG